MRGQEAMSTSCREGGSVDGRKEFYIVKVVKCYKGLCREVVQSRCLDIPKAQLDKACCNLTLHQSCPCYNEGLDERPTEVLSN